MFALRQVLGVRATQFILLTIVAVVAIYSRTVVSPLQEMMRIALALRDNQMALLQGPAMSLPFVVAAIPLGLIVDRYSRVRVLFIFALSNLAGTVLTAVASHFALLFLARCLVGLTSTATNIAAFSVIADLYPPAQRGRASMIVVLGEFGGMAAAFALGGALAGIYGPGPDGWRWAMIWLAAPLVPVALLIFAMRDPPRAGVPIGAPPVWKAFVQLWVYRAVIGPLLVGMAMAQTAQGSALVWAAPTFSRNFALPPGRVGVIMSIVVFMSGILGSIAGGTLADACHRTGGPRRTTLAVNALALLTIPACLFGISPWVGSASILLFALVTLIGAIIVTGITLVTIVIPSELRGVCLAAIIGTNALFGGALGPPAVSFLSGMIGGPPMIGRALALVCTLACLVATGAFGFGRRNFAPTTRQTQASAD
jgi:MFS family permease